MNPVLKQVAIAAVGVDAAGGLLVKPATPVIVMKASRQANVNSSYACRNRHDSFVLLKTANKIVVLKRIGEPAMAKMIFISLPVTHLAASMKFYQSIGFVNNPAFTDDTAACMVWSETINVMLLTQEKWRTFTTRPIPPSTSSEVALALSCDSRKAVDAMNEAAAANGGTADINPVQDHGSMYGRDMTDPDGHVWGAMWMDPTAIPSGDQQK